jgi:hypothetical protein
MAYTTIDDPSAYFQTDIYTGDGSTTQAQTFDGNSDMQPDMVWIKERSETRSHVLFDSIRGVTVQLNTNGDASDATVNDSLKVFGSDGYSVGPNNSTGKNTETYVAWGWKAGTAFSNDASSTSIGTIDSVGSASDTSGFSIVSFTGTGSNGTIKHGLSTAPDLFIIKRRDDTNDWRIGSSALDNFVKHINLNTTAAQSDLAVAFNSTGPTTSVFSVGTSVSTNASGGTYIAYCFSNIKGFSKAGKYIGNGNANGTFVYTGFKPAWILAKRLDSTSAGNWQLVDNKRSPFNVAVNTLSPDVSDAEYTSETDIDILSNGFKIRENAQINVDDSPYIYLAFAESPLVTSTGVPTTAR